MRRIVILLFAIVLTSFSAFAQDYKWMDNIKVGAELGFSIPSMRYSSPIYDSYKKSVKNEISITEKIFEIKSKSKNSF